MRIRINLKIFLIILLFALTGQSKFYAFMMLFLVLHEIGHLCMRINFRVQTSTNKYNAASDFQ